ncbi:hypothetical protein [Candidimonas nitroreducens]|uniref:Uracil-DNA glycosylase-like domain-containing protein n=1 Tax=Candidimonas nitroreducens TaxID=683354 RepID=A0A225MQZ0_9BURK|nr:hypothetical protein [Candidimonas nitroreducens]OWT63704.1 hypothetical protein CEY11_05130 [Candidimonas nitroreducens]
MQDDPQRFEHYAPAIRELDLGRIGKPAEIPRRFDLGRDGRLSSHYIPFDHVNPRARLVLVGITPGFTQWKNAMREAQRQLAAAAPEHVDLAAVKRAGAFSGTLRPNLIALLDHIGLQHWLGLASCAALFGAASHLVHTGSILHHPVFIDGRNYNGTPNMLRTPFLQRQIEAHFAATARALGPAAVFVPLGPGVSAGIRWLAQQGVIAPDRVLHGLPHPSGANVERIAYFLGRKNRATLSAKTNADKLDTLRHELQAQVRGLDQIID